PRAEGGRERGMTPAGAAMLRLLDRATTRWHFPVVGRAKGRLLRRLLAQHRPRRAVEIGSLFGYSAILIAGSLPPGGRLVALEANPFMGWMIAANVRGGGLGRRGAGRGGERRRV